MKFEIDPSQIQASKIPHEIFLTNLIVNHILYFAFALSASSLPQLIAVTPIVSIAMLGYTLLRGRLELRRAPWFVARHWEVAIRRSRMLLLMLFALGLLLGLLYAIHIFAEVPFPQIFPLAAVSTMPVMVTILALIIMESEALHHARSGQLSKGVVEKNPPPAELAILEE